MSEVHYLASGDTALTVDFGNIISETINQQVMALRDEITKQNWNGIVATVPTFRSLFIQYDPCVLSHEELCRRLETRHLTLNTKHLPVHRIIEIPVCYGARFGPDLRDGEKLTGLSADEIIALHSGHNYRIYMLGFLPGFPYLGGLDERICMPRLATPRTRIPAGSVGIGGSQTGIYPVDSPGGWRLIGATPLTLYDPSREHPIPYKSGDYIRFVPVDISDYYDIRREAERGAYSFRFLDASAVSEGGDIL